MKERLLEFLSYLGIGQTKFEEKVGLSRGLINKIKGNISLDSLKKITDKYPELNAEWLTYGEGEMLKTGNTQTVGDISNSTVGDIVAGGKRVKKIKYIENNETNNYDGLSVEGLINMMEERFQHVLKKEDDIRAIFEENRKLTNEVIRQNADFRMYNEAYRRQAERIAELTDKLLEREKL